MQTRCLPLKTMWNVTPGQAEIVAVIPARGGSKGLKRKNVALLNGKPLIAYSIEAARAAKMVGRVIVSTEDPEIADIAREHGAEVPFLRPAHLAHDRSLIGQALEHCIQHLQPRPTLLVQLYPTNPFRPQGLVDRLVQAILEGFSRAVTVLPVAQRGPYFVPVSRDPLENLARPLCIVQPEYAREHQPLVVSSGSCLAEWLDHSDPGHFGTYIHPLTDPVHQIDIDTPSDFQLAERVLSNRLHQGGPC